MRSQLLRESLCEAESDTNPTRKRGKGVLDRCNVQFRCLRVGLVFMPLESTELPCQRKRVP